MSDNVLKFVDFPPAVEKCLDNMALVLGQLAEFDAIVTQDVAAAILVRLNRELETLQTVHKADIQKTVRYIRDQLEAAGKIKVVQSGCDKPLSPAT